MNTCWKALFCVNLAALTFSATFANDQGNNLQVLNVFATQIQNPALIFVSYTLETVGDVPATITLYLSTDGGISYPHICRSVTGDVGAGILPGLSRHIFWNAAADIPGIRGSDCRLRVTADDGIQTIYIAPGTFTMGSPVNELGRDAGEVQHQVTITHGFDIQIHEVTNRQFAEMAQWAFDHGYVTVAGGKLRDNMDGSSVTLKFLDAADSEISYVDGVFDCINPDRPVAAVMWYGAAAYCDWISMQRGLPRAYDHSTWQCNGGNPYLAAGYRLPTEAEWEYACRAGSTTAFANGPIAHAECSPIEPILDVIGWYCGNAGGSVHPVAQGIANSWGLHDMHGNAWEWCNDWHAAYSGDETDPPGRSGGGDRVVRGGNWDSPARYCRSAHRGFDGPSELSPGWGFRTVRSAD